MLKLAIEDRVENVLESSGYATARYHGCFDIAAKKKNILLLKILQNIDAFSEEQSENLKLISANLDAMPLVVGEQTRMEKLQAGVVYERYEMPAVNFHTFKRLIEEEIFPTVYRDRGGLYVHVDSEALRALRTEKGLTQAELAELVNINKKVVYEHERQQSRMVLEIAQKLENVLRHSLIKNAFLNVAANSAAKERKTMPKDKMEKEIGSKLAAIGFKVAYAASAPFDILAREHTLVISDVESNKRRLSKRAPALKNFAAVMQKPALFITERHGEDTFDGVPVMRRDELKELESSKQLIKFAKKISINS